MSQKNCLAALDVFSALEDSRQLAKMRYPLNEIILAVLCASI